MMVSRYLTPSRISLLALIAMYCDDYVPADGRVPVLRFITARLLPPHPSKRKKALNVSDSVSMTLEDFRKALSPFKKPDHAKNLWEEFVVIMWKISNLDLLFDFFKSLPCLFGSRDKQFADDEQTVLSKTSLIGTFVRRSTLEYERLNFQDSVRLWQNYQRFRAPSSPPGRLFVRTDADIDTDLNVLDMDRRPNGQILSILAKEEREDDQGASNVVSLIDVEKLLAFQIERMQNFGNRLPDETRAHLEQTAYLSSEVSSLSHYASFLDAWSSGDYPSSFEYLHRYYDYAMHNKDRSQYQYALLNMAILQADFGSNDEAVAAMHETIATARENKDMPCLNFSLSWLYHFRTICEYDVKGNADQSLLGSDAKSLAFLKTKAQESNMWSVVSSTLMNEARLYLSQGRRPYEALEKIYESSHLNVQHSIHSAQGSQLLLQASIFARIGVTSLSSAYYNLLIDGYQHELRAEEPLRARCRMAYTCILSGDYKGAAKALDAVKPEVNQNLQLHQLLSYQIGMAELKKSFHRNDLDKAELILASLGSAPSSDPELQMQISMLRFEYLKRRKDYHAAFSLIEELSTRSQDISSSGSSNIYDTQYRMRLLSAKALLFAQCGRPQKGLSVALRATVASLEARVLPAVWEGAGALAGVLVSIGEPEAAQRLLDSCVWQAAETGDMALIALLQGTYADAAIAIAGKTRGVPETNRSSLQRALAWVQWAYESYNTLGDVLGQREMTAKSAVVMRLLGDETGAAEKMKLYNSLPEHDFVA